MGKLNENLKRYRKERHYTLEYVANYIGVTKQTVQRYESGVIKDIPNDKIEKLAELFDVDPSRLVGWQEVEDIDGISIVLCNKKAYPIHTELLTEIIDMDFELQELLSVIARKLNDDEIEKRLLERKKVD